MPALSAAAAVSVVTKGKTYYFYWPIIARTHARAIAIFVRDTRGQYVTSPAPPFINSKRTILPVLSVADTLCLPVTTRVTLFARRGSVIQGFARYRCADRSRVS